MKHISQDNFFLSIKVWNEIWTEKSHMKQYNIELELYQKYTDDRASMSVPFSRHRFGKIDKVSQVQQLFFYILRYFFQ